MRRSSPLKDSILDLFDDDILKNNLSSPPAADSMEGDTEHAVEEQGNIVKSVHTPILSAGRRLRSSLTWRAVRPAG